MQRSMYFRLSGLMFFQLLVVGTYSPMIGTYLKDTLHFSGQDVGIILSIFQGTAMISPLLGAFLVDRLIPSRVMFSSLHLISAILVVLLSFQTQFWPVLILLAVYSFFLGPTSGLMNSLSFARLPDGKKYYGAIRLWGTAGWIAAAWILGGLWLLPGAQQRWMFWLAAGASIVSGMIVWLLPHVPVKKLEKFELIPKESFKIFIQPEILKFGLVYFLSGIMDRFYYIGTAPYLKQLGFTDSTLMPAMTLGQFTEIGLLVLTGPLLKRWSFRAVLSLGLGVQFLRFFLLMVSPFPPIVLVALSLNGFVFAFFYAVSVIHIDSFADQQTRGGVHQLMGLIFAGTSSLVGSMIAGLAFDWFKSGAAGVAEKVNYAFFWMIPTVIAIAAVVLTLIFFKNRKIQGETTLQSALPEDV